MTGNSSTSDEEETSSSRPQHEQFVQENEVNEDGSGNDSGSGNGKSSFNNDNNNNNNNNNASAVQVAVRVRPLLSSLESGCAQCIDVIHTGLDERPSTIKVGGESGPTFTFDEVFPTSTTQTQVFEHRVSPLVDSCLEGYNATILAYGQTGSGKTHTVIGPSPSSPVQDELLAGMIPRAVRALFEKLQSAKQQQQQQQQQHSQEELPEQGLNKNTNSTGLSFEFNVRVQFLELYGEEIRDLLTSTTSAEKLSIRDIGNDEPEVVGATSQTVESAEEALRCLTKGMLRRVTATTAMNESSSRSHAIFSILIDQTWMDEKDATGPQVRRSKFNFVDLAGSERQKRTQAAGKRLKEGIDINKGLLVLGNVISALGDPKKRGKAFVPYRDSKLTRLLKGSLGGNHKTLMVACVSPASTNMEESLNCLRYANRAKNIQNHAVVNVDARSRLVAELKTQVQALAADLLKAKDSGMEGQFTRELLIALASGESPDAWEGPKSPLKASARFFNNESQRADLERLHETEEELSRTTNLLKKARRENFTLEEKLHVVQAERELYRLQLAAVTGETEKHDVTKNGELDSNKLFVDRAAQYEKEIDRLKEELHAMRAQVVEKTIPDDLNTDVMILKAHQGLRAERETLSHIQKDLMSKWDEAGSTEGVQPDMHIEVAAHEHSEKQNAVLDELEAIDSDERTEQEKLDALSLKYSNMDNEDVLVADKDGEASHFHADEELTATPQTSTQEKLAEQRRAQIEADLLEINRIIESKEELISQLQCSQAKYSSMKEFYEGKLSHMEQLLEQKEQEREKLILELEELKNNNSDTRELEEELKRQEEHIAGIKKQKRQLKDLTAVSSKNAFEIQKLQNDVKFMKEKKVSMQKQLSEERKAHAMEIKMLKKEVIQKDRETRKWQRAAGQRESEVERAQQMAKQKMGQLGQLRAKYKDAEKTIRMLQVKRGVMAKAGLDSVMVGRRSSDKGKNATKGSQNASNDSSRTIDFDGLRDYFDNKVGEVGRKESLADKVAHGWEEHFQLTLRHEELMKENTDAALEEVQALELRIQYEEDRIRKLAHGLTRRQTKSNTEERNESKKIDSFLYDQEFQKVMNGVPPRAASEVAAKVLFGMVVRERRRIASLAKTASSLDEKLEACQKEIEEKEEAFRSYVEDSRQDLTNISLNHQEQILSLMSLVKTGNNLTTSDGRLSGDNETVAAETSGSPADAKLSSEMLVLANERISLLEQQLLDLKSEQKVNKALRLEKEELQNSLKEKSVEYEELETRLAALRSTLRQIRHLITSGSSAPDFTANGNNAGDSAPVSLESAKLDRECLSIIKEALRVSPGPMSPMARRHSCPNIFRMDIQSPRSERQWDIMRSADDGDEDEEETPEWADEIMADLAFIAEGQMPPSLQMLPALEGKADEGTTVDGFAALSSLLSENQRSEGPTSSSVKEQLKSLGSEDDASASTSTGSSGSPARVSKLSPPRAGKTTPQEGTIQITPNSSSEERFVKLSTPSPARASFDSAKNKGRDPTDRSVFDRLVSPTNFTGTQKTRQSQPQTVPPKERQQLHSGGAQQPQISSKAEEIAERMLDSLLKNEDDRFQNHPSEPSSKINEYTQQNVFERLQKTTTQSFAVKHVPETSQEVNQSFHASEKQKQEDNQKLSSKAAPKRIAPSEADSFKSPGESSNNGTPSSRPSTPPKSRGRSSNGGATGTAMKSTQRRERKEDYTQQNVFERLQRTTTEAYAIKKKKEQQKG